MKKNLSDFGFANRFLFEYKGLKKKCFCFKNNAKISKNIKKWQKISKSIFPHYIQEEPSLKFPNA